MLTIAIIALVIWGLGYIACLVTAALGGVTDFMGIETWCNKKCERWYYRIAPVSLVSFAVSFVSMIIAAVIKGLPQ